MTRIVRYGAVRAARGARVAQHLLEAVDVAVREDGARRLGQPDAIDDRGVVELVADDQVALGGDGRDDAAVGGQAGLERQHRLDVLEVRQPALQLLDQLVVAGDRAHRARAHAQLADGLQRRLDEVRMRGQAEVVVRRQADDRLAVDRPCATACGPVMTRSGRYRFLALELVELVVQVGEGIARSSRGISSAVGLRPLLSLAPPAGRRTTLPAWPAATRSKACA